MKKQLAGTWLALASLIGLFLSFYLLNSELKVLRDPASSLACDVNPLIACSSSLLSPQAHLFLGIPNSIIGLAAFAVLLGLSSVVAFNKELPRFFWPLILIGSTVSLGYIGFFVYASINIFHALCPYCMGIWLVSLIIFPIALGYSASIGVLGNRFKKIGEVFLKYWWGFTAIASLLIVLVIVVGLSDKIAMVF